MQNDRVRLVQLLCGPKRHAIMAIAYLPGMSAGGSDDNDIVLTQNTAIPYLKEMIAGWLSKKIINPWCGLCNAQVDAWFYEDAPTKFRSLDEALPHLKAAETKNLEARSLIGSTKDRRN